MKSKFLAVLFIATLATASFAADVTGKWTAEVAGRNGQTRTTNFDFKVEGEKLTGTMSGGQGGDQPIVDGTAKGDDIAFNVVVNFNGNEMKLVYKGKVAGDVIKMSRTREGAEGPAQEFEAKRVK
jgi:opacity protein-like surface antigen